MSKKQRKVFWPVLFIVGLAVGVVAFASARRVRESKAIGPSPVVNFQNPSTSGNNERNARVHPGALWPQLRWNLKALGDRLEKPGKERLSLTGTLSRAGNAVPVPVLLILEFPDHLRLEMQGVGPAQVITFNGKSAGKVGGPLDQSEEDLIETLVYDTAEHFFGGQSQGTATRFLGDHFRLDDGAQANYTGPFYDVYQTTEQVKHVVPAREQTKLFCFNSDTHLLERISYELERNGPRTAVEIRISGWHKVQDQQVPVQIIRLENNQPALTLTINSAALTTKVDDGAFGN